MIVRLTIKNVQHIELLEFEIDSADHGIVCLTGKNSTGKTTLIKSFLNLYQSDTFKRTSSPYIFSDKSEITISVDETVITYRYNSKLSTIDTKQIVPKTIKELFLVELPLPHGTRFKHFQKLSEIDDSLRTKIALSEISVPEELISFLSRIYKTDRFNDLRSANINGESYYFIALRDKYYIREDYLSSGEYFLISLFKSIKKNKKIIFIDEIDVSLDASAQVSLVRELRSLCDTYKIKIVFTTHSLPLMKTLNTNELYYISRENNKITAECRSYNYIKSVLFGFSGWDRYILTEDKMIERYLNYCLAKNSPTTFLEYKIIFIGGADQVVDLARRNAEESFLSSPNNILCVLDGDQKEKHGRNKDQKICFLPFESIEKSILSYYESGNLQAGHFELAATKKKAKGSELMKKIIRSKNMTHTDIFEFLDSTSPNAATEFQLFLVGFLNP